MNKGKGEGTTAVMQKQVVAKNGNNGEKFNKRKQMKACAAVRT